MQTNKRGGVCYITADQWKYWNCFMDVRRHWHLYKDKNYYYASKEIVIPNQVSVSLKLLVQNNTKEDIKEYAPCILKNSGICKI